MSSATRVEVLRETVKVAKFELPPEALPQPEPDAPVVTTKRLKASRSPVAGSMPRWERHVAAALWVIAAAIVATLWFIRT